MFLDLFGFPRISGSRPPVGSGPPNVRSETGAGPKSRERNRERAHKSGAKSGARPKVGSEVGGEVGREDGGEVGSEAGGEVASEVGGEVGRDVGGEVEGAVGVKIAWPLLALCLVQSCIWRWVQRTRLACTHMLPLCVAASLQIYTIDGVYHDFCPLSIVAS